MTMRFYILAVLFLGLFAAACSEQRTQQRATPATANAAASKPSKISAARSSDFGTVMRGGRLFQQNCASCHGQLAQGHTNWQKPDANGKYPPPPLNGTGHTWHHPKAALKDTIKEGTVKLGGSMPAWGHKLSDGDIEAIIAWLQSHWPDEIYAAWLEMDRSAQSGQRSR